MSAKDALAEYRRRWDFSRTAEPGDGAGGPGDAVREEPAPSGGTRGGRTG
jgi:hypothetical protein